MNHSPEASAHESSGDFVTTLGVVDDRFAQFNNSQRMEAGHLYLERLLLQAGKGLKSLLGKPEAFNGGAELLMHKLKLWMDEVQAFEKNYPIVSDEVMHLFSEFHEYTHQEETPPVNSIRSQVHARLSDAQGVVTSLRSVKIEGGAYSMESAKAIKLLQGINRMLAGMLEKSGISPLDKKLILSAGGLVLSCIKQVRHGGREDLISAFSGELVIPEGVTVQ